uniref:Pre-mRNA-processing factor 19 n=1 Tax=Henneguya salminicola TaxID=69463 RepID=A0A6G3MEZ3_HENSL
MAFVCSLSGEIAQTPVVSLLSKNLFESRILEKYVEANGKDPITDEPMTLDDIIPIKTSTTVAPKLSYQSGIPVLLKTLQDEWDTFALQNHIKSKKLNSIKKELSLSLYQLDSACRIIARLLKENDELKQLLSQAGVDVSEGKEMEIVTTLLFIH